MANSPIDVIRQYLVSLGFEVDKASYDSATKAIDSTGESLAKLAGTTVKQFGLATAAVTSFVTTAVVGMAKFLGDLGNAQIQYEMLSRQLWTTQQNAEAFSTTLKAMGRSLNDLYLSPTLMAQFQQLNKQAFEMMPPAEYQQQMKFIQDISFQFTRMKLEGTYALQWIGYYFIKYMSGPLNNIYQTLTHLNDIIIKTMPYWTKVVAEVMSWFAQFGVTTVESIKDIARVFNDIGNSIPKNIKLIGLALLGLLLIMNQGPIGWIIDAFVILELLLNDFFAYIHGGKAEFGAFWQKLIDFYDKLKESGAIDAFKNAFEIAMKTSSKWLKTVIDDVGKFLGNTDNLKTLAAAVAGIAAAFMTFKGIEKILQVVTAAQWLLNFALDANPIGIVALAVGALVFAFVLLGKKSSRFNDIIESLKHTFKTTFDIIGKLVDGAIDWFSSMWDTLNQSGIIQDLGNDFVDLMNSVLNVVNAVLDLTNQFLGLQDTQSTFKSIGDWINQFILQNLQTVDELLKQIASGLNASADLFKGDWGGAWDNFKDIFTKDLTPPSKNSYMYPSTSNNHTNNSNTNNMNVTQNIYGSSDPNATANAASSNLTTVMRNARGVIV